MLRIFSRQSYISFSKIGFPSTGLTHIPKLTTGWLIPLRPSHLLRWKVPEPRRRFPSPQVLKATWRINKVSYLHGISPSKKATHCCPKIVSELDSENLCFATQHGPLGTQDPGDRPQCQIIEIKSLKHRWSRYLETGQHCSPVRHQGVMRLSLMSFSTAYKDTWDVLEKEKMQWLKNY